MSLPSWHVLGTGSIGGLFAARLVAAGFEPVLLLRDESARAAYDAAGGIAVEDPDGRWQRVQPATLVAGECPAPARHLLVTTKAPDTLHALEPWLAGDGRGQLVLLLQNGMGVSEQVRERWPRLRLWNGVTTAGAWRDGPFRLHCVAIGDSHAGRWDDAGDPDGDPAVGALFAAGLFLPGHDIRALLWRKLAVNAVINALTAIHRCRNGDLLEREDARAMLPLLAQEVEAVAAADGIRFDEPVLALAGRVIRLTAGNYSSMNRDVAAGRPTEIEFINGYVVARAARHGIAVPANATVFAAVRRLA